MTDEISLNRHILDYYATEDDGYVEAWVLISHRRSTDLEAEGSSLVAVAVKPDQSWVTTRGLLEIARENGTVTGIQEWDDDDD